MFSERISFKDEDPPCKNCNNRYASCHSTCEDYKAWKIDHDLKLTEINRKRRTDATYKAHVAEYVAKRRGKRKR